MNSELLLAYRFLRGSKAEKSISLMIKICFISIFVGTCALALVSFIMSGFEKATYQKLQNIHADIIIRSKNRAINYKKIKEVLETEFKKDIISYSGSSYTQVIIQNNINNQTLQTAVILKAIDPELENKVNNLNNFILDKLDISHILKNNNIIIGKKLAENLLIKKNSIINILYPSDTENKDNNSVSFDSKAVTVSGFFNIGIEEFDERVIFCNLDLFQELFNTGITEINIKLKDINNEADIINRLKKRFSLEVLSWKDLYPALVSSLVLEKYVMFIIFFLMAIITSINSIALIFMFITHKQADIALLKSLGISENKLIKIFIYLGSIISLTAGISGMLIAILIGKILQIFPIKLPAAYIVDYLPVTINLKIISIILFTIFIISFITILLPVKKIKNIPVIFTLKRK